MELRMNRTQQVEHGGISDPPGLEAGDKVIRVE